MIMFVENVLFSLYLDGKKMFLVALISRKQRHKRLIMLKFPGADIQIVICGTLVKFSALFSLTLVVLVSTMQDFRMGVQAPNTSTLSATVHRHFKSSDLPNII